MNIELFGFSIKFDKNENRAVASMGQGGHLPPPPRFECCPPDGFCPGHGRKPAFGNEAIASQKFD